MRDLLLLAARVAALLLLAAAFARPYVQGAAPAPLRVVAIDRSYSMGAPGVFARALELARQAIDEAASGERVAVVAFDDRADVLAVPGGAPRPVRRSTGSHPGSALRATVRCFQQAVDFAAGATGRLVVITDLQRAGWEGEPSSSLPAGWSLDVRDVTRCRRRPENLAVTAVTVEADRVVAAIRNDGATAQAGRVRVDSRRTGGRGGRLRRGARRNDRRADRVARTESGALSVAIDDPDGLPADNVRFVALGSERADRRCSSSRTESRVVPRRGRSEPPAHRRQTEKTVEVVPGSRVARLTDRAAGELSRSGSRFRPAVSSARARERLMSSVKSGGGLFIAAAPELEPAVLAEMTGWQPPLTAVEQVGPLTLAATDLRHPIFRPFGALAANLGQVRFDRVWRLSPDGWSVVARFSNGTPALLERALGQRPRSCSLRPMSIAGGTISHSTPRSCRSRSKACGTWRATAASLGTTPSPRRRPKRDTVQAFTGPPTIGRLRSTWTRERAPRDRIDSDGLRGHGATIGRGAPRRPPTGRRSKPSHGRVIGSMAWCS